MYHKSAITDQDFDDEIWRKETNWKT